MVDGFSLHADVSVAAEDRRGLERLCRYALRSSFSLQRLSVRPDGQVVYRLKRPWPTAGGATELVLDPVEFLRRLARLIPAPRANLVRYHGAFSSNSALRDRIIPRVPKPGRTCEHVGSAAPGGAESQQPPASSDCSSPRARAAADELLASGRLPASATVASLDELILPPALLGPPPEAEQRGELRDRYLDWGSLLKRVFGEEILVCSRCGHSPMRVIAAIDDAPIVEKILVHLGLPSERPVICPARSPPRFEFDDELGDSDFGDPDFDVLGAN